jgi:hypothetical protein
VHPFSAAPLGGELHLLLDQLVALTAHEQQAV